MSQLPMCSVLLSVLLFLTGVSVASAQYQLKDEVNLCDKRPGHEPNGEHLGQPGVHLVAVTTAREPRCLMKFTTCSRCRLHVTANASFHYTACSSQAAHLEDNGWCVPGCTYIQLYDKDYSNKTAVTYSSSSSMVGGYPQILDFSTESRTLYVIACANKTSDQHVFIGLNITAENKIQYFEGRESDIGRQYTFKSPFFPSEYVLNSETYMYIFQAPTQDDFITISFDDWQLSQYSSITFNSANVKGPILGTNYRPWIISDSRRLVMTFDTGPYKIPGTLRASKGFKATYMFHRGDREDMPYVHTGCGLWIDHKESGQISFNPNGNGQEYYDCIWVIKKHPSYQRVLISVVNYTTRDRTHHQDDQPSLLEIREGLTSEGRLVIAATPSLDAEDKQTFKTYDSTVGFYVRLKGHYWGHRDFVLSFTSFSLDQCRNLFWCTNGRCVPSQVECDGIDNCGDGSDEGYRNCVSGGSADNNSSSGGLTLFSPVIIIPIVVGVFILLVICLLAIFIRRCRRLSCQARQAQRRQGRVISSVSGSVSPHEQRRHGRRRGEWRMDSVGPSEVLHDLPPSYEDVLTATPIGYLNLGYSDSTHLSTDLIQPPSYDEAVRPATQDPPLECPPGQRQDESSDSSAAETGRRPLLTQSSSYSTDDMQRSRADEHQPLATTISSSDSSNEGDWGREGAVDWQRRGRGDGDRQRERTDNRQTEGGQPHAGGSVAKPEDQRIVLPDCSSCDLGHHKGVKGQGKASGGGHDKNELVSDIITECAASSSAAAPVPHSQGHPSSVCRVETSPVVTAPSVFTASSSSHEGQAGRLEEEGGGGVGAGPRAACSAPTASPSQDPPAQPGFPATEGELLTHPPDTSPSPRQTRGRPGPGRRVPPHIQKLKAPSHMMKHLSRSMNDLDRQGVDSSRSDHQRDARPSRHWSHSMQNLLDCPGDGHHRTVEHSLSELNRRLHHHRHHHHSQTLPAPEDMLTRRPDPEGRDAVLPGSGQGRRARSEDFVERNRSRSDERSSGGQPDPRHGDPVRMEPGQRGGEEGGEGAPPTTTNNRPKPQPKPRRLHQAGGRPKPEPRKRLSTGGGHRHHDQPPSPDRYQPSGERYHQSGDWYTAGIDRHGPVSDEHRPQSHRRTTAQSADNVNLPTAGGERRADSSDGRQQGDRGRPTDRRSSTQAMAGGQCRDHRQHTDRPLAPPKPDRASRAYIAGVQDLPKPDLSGHGNRGRYVAGVSPPQDSSRIQNSHPSYRRADPPPYRPRDWNGPTRPTSVHGPASPSQPNPPAHIPYPSNHSQLSARSLHPRDTAPNHPPHSGHSPSSSAHFPRTGGVQSVPRYGQHTEGMAATPPGGSTGGEGHSAPTSPRLPARPDIAATVDGFVVMTSPPGAGGSAPFLSLRLEGQGEEGEEDIYV
ncbi:uncharacterized protein LOC143300468 [Babylonia areolata]|uniref:uncharacterized protein LOC143300468 n=1 Tax=Babylonia areolata TaxID=304850 RepID=UPI003FCFC365